MASLKLFIYAIASSFLFGHARGAIAQLDVNGLVAAVFTPFDDDLKLNVSVVPEQAAYLNATGVEYILVAGTTGESVALSQSEREKLLEAWVAAAPQYNTKLIVHVGANCLEESRQLSQHAVSLNSPYIVAFASMPTSYFRPSTIEGLTELMKDIASAAPSLPFYYYHIPSMTMVEFSMYDFMTYAGPHIPNLAGIKWTGLYDSQSSFPDVLRLMDYKDENGRTYEVMTGRDEMLLQCLVSGVKGFVGSQYNFAGDLYNDLIKEYNEGNIVKARQLNLDVINLLVQVEYNMTADRNAFKYLMVEAGVNVGDARPPTIKLNDKEKAWQDTNLKGWCGQSNNAVTRMCR